MFMSDKLKMNSIDLKSCKLIDEFNFESSNQMSLSSQSANNLNKETSFNGSDLKNGPSILLKHNVSKKSFDYQPEKSRSTPYLADRRGNVDLIDAKLLSGQFRTNMLANNYLTGSPKLFKNSSNLLLTSTPNLFNNFNGSKILESPTLNKLLPVTNSDSPSISGNSFPPAIQVKNVSFDYRNNTLHASNILKNVNLTCKIGSIYGLLGPSGCGKTTLIKLILSKYRPIKGEIRAFGYDVKSKYSGMVGSGVGYMPQELALIFHFTIEEQFTYFGRLYFMPYDKIRKEINYLCGILDLPEKTRPIHQLSGGQQHRVSFACALIHKPRLLILDEPTVGLDPILRERIWLQLLSLTKNLKTTILITTHYIEEAKRANTIGFLRKGQLLVEQTPQYLMKKYATNSLEKIFFKLCIEQMRSKKAKNKIQVDVNFNNSLNEIIEKSQSKPDQQTPSTSSSSSPDLNELKLTNDYRNEYNTNSSSSDGSENFFKIPWIDRYNRSGISKWFIQFFAITIKYFILTKRRPETVLAQYVLPIIAIAVFCVCIGSTPTGIKIGVLNEEDCGYPFDMNQNFTQPIPENSIEEFIKRFEIFIGLTKSDNDVNKSASDDQIKLRKRSIDEVTTLNLNIFNEEEEATTIYPSKFNLMNNLNFNENKNEMISETEPKNLNDLPESYSSTDLIKRLISEIPTTYATPSAESSLHLSSNSLNNHKMDFNMTMHSREDTGASSPDTNSSNNHNLANENEKMEDAPVLVSTSSNDDNSNELDSGDSNENHNNSTENSTDEKTPTKTEEEEEYFDDEMKSHLINSQFENACFSQDLIRKMNSFIFKKIPYDSHEKAIEDIRSGKIWGVIRIKKGFSRALVSKILFQDYGDVNINDSLVEINADLTNNALTITMDVTLSRLYPEFIKDVLVKANQINRKSNANNHTDYKFYNLNSGRLPIILGSHVFKAKFTLSDYFGIREFAAPGLLIILTYSVSYALTVFSLVTEISDKMFDRHQCIGLTSNQLIFSHLITRFIFSATGTILVVLMSIYFFDISNHGSFLSAITLLLLQSYCAMTHGMLISVLCPSLFICAAISNGYLFFVFIISGVLWSFETLPPVMKQIGILLPSTIPCESLRTIMTRGQGFESNTVVYGYLITIIWIFIHYFATIIVFNYRKTSK